MKISRRQFLKLTATGAAFALPAFGELSRAVSAQTQTADDELAAIKSRCERVVREYDTQGVHRTATEVDSESAKWLAKLVEKTGAKPQLEPFKINRIDLVENYLQIGDRRIEGIPMFDGGFTDKKGIRGRVGKIGSDAEIGLIEAPPNAATDFNDAFIQARRNSKHKAIVIVTKGGADGIALINAPYFLEPFAQPALQIGREHGEFLQQSAEQNREVLLVASVERKQATAYNVTAEIAGSEPKLTPIGVITPRSGWWEIASERGGGLCAWLETMRAVAKAKPKRTVYFAASSGHELGHVGLENYFDRRADLAKNAFVWLHYGANIGSKMGASRSMRATSEEFEKLAVEALTAEGVPPNRLMPRNVIPHGEAKNIYKRGGKFISLIGGNALFHLPQDRYPEAMDFDVAARVSAAFSNLVVKLANS